jgi:hypothetical protein
MKRKDIHRYRFFIFLFQFWIFEFWTSSYKNETNLLLFRITISISDQFAGFVLFSMLLAILYFGLDYGIPYPSREPNFAAGNYSGFDCGLLVFFTHSILTSCIQRTIFGARFGGKDFRFVHIQPVCRISRMIRGTFVWSGSELWSLFKNSKLKLKNQKPLVIF